MRSEARALLAQLTEDQGTDGVLRLDAVEGANLPPGSMAFPPCQCPQHREDAVRVVLSDKVRAANAQSTGDQS